MARLKNALRVHEIGVFNPATPTTEPKEWLKLAKYIETVNDESDEDTDDTGYYDGDGTPEETVLSVVGGFSFEGLYDAEDKAQALIASMKYKIGDARRVWFRVTSADQKKTWTEVANVSEIKTGDGDATEYEAFECTIKWIRQPKEAAKSI